MLGLSLNWGIESLDDLEDSLLTSVSLSNPTALLGKGRTSLHTWGCAQAFQAKLQNSKISMLIQKHFLNDSADPSDFFLKGWEWPGSQWGRRMISLVLAGWALLTVWLQKMWVGLPKIPWKIHCQCWQDRKYKQKHLCVCWAQLYMGY